MTPNARENDQAFLSDGSEWPEYEDCIVGNEAGLIALRDAIDQAIKAGKHYGDNLGDYVGVWCLEGPPQINSARAGSILGRIIGGTVAVAFLICLLAGFATITRWVLDHLVGV